LIFKQVAACGVDLAASGTLRQIILSLENICVLLQYIFDNQNKKKEYGGTSEY